MQRSIINNILYLYFPLSATRKLPRLNSEPNGGGFDKEYDGGYGTKVSGNYDETIKSSHEEYLFN